ncbi:MAG: glutamate 5-kinase [Acidimicrobiia bacterium]|nr:glutamate 5-kinase [Acidimicrobiia bacterium]
MRYPIASAGPIVVKVGSSSLTGVDGIDEVAIRRIVDQVSDAWESGRGVVLVTSGAVAAGLPALGLTTRPRDVAGLQVAAAVGQGRLMARYIQLFSERGIVAGQVLLTRAVFGDREQYLNARQALERMIARRIVPIVNENDTVGIEELRFGDNDRLAALVSHLTSGAVLVLLTDTDGLLTADPRRSEDAALVSAVRHTDEILDRLAAGGAGPLGSGGIATKVAAARIAAWSGIPTVVTSASDPTALRRVLDGEDIGTWVGPQDTRLPARKLWIAFGQPAEGSITIDDGAVRAIIAQGRSLLPVGVKQVDGEFGAGAAVEVKGPDAALVAKGVTRLGASELRRAAGLKTTEAGGLAIHRDDLVVLAG